MSDDLLLPTVPEATPDDPEDVSWALSTAEAMWARGDHLEGIKWVRRAAEAASETENDLRALELAKAAADLTSLISRMSRAAAIEIEEVEAISDVEPQPPPAPKGRPPPPKASAAPKPLPTSVTKQVVTPSRPPAPLPSRTSQPPAPGATALKGKPLGTNTGRPPSMRPGPGKGAPAEKRESKRAARRSRENLDAEARAALALSPPPTGFAGSDMATAESPVQPVVHVRSASADPTAMSNVNEIVRGATKRTTDEWDLSPTQNLTGEELPYGMPAATPVDGSAQHAPDFKATMQSFPRPSAPAAAPAGTGTNPPATVAAVMPQGLGAGAIPSGPGGYTSASPPGASAAQARPATAAAEPHDPQIMTSQAVRVVVWRDASGVHVAPAGTIVSAITVDAMLVALEPNADLTAWLSQRTR